MLRRLGQERRRGKGVRNFCICANILSGLPRQVLGTTYGDTGYAMEARKEMDYSVCCWLLALHEHCHTTFIFFETSSVLCFICVKKLKMPLLFGLTYHQVEKMFFTIFFCKNSLLKTQIDNCIILKSFEFCIRYFLQDVSFSLSLAFISFNNT